jgi:hypothetical protein
VPSAFAQASWPESARIARCPIFTLIGSAFKVGEDTIEKRFRMLDHRSMADIDQIAAQAGHRGSRPAGISRALLDRVNRVARNAAMIVVIFTSPTRCRS